MTTSVTLPKATGTNPIKELLDYGQSPWMDYIRRDLLTGGGLKKMIDGDGLRGQTSIQKRIEYDLYYIENWSLLLDLKILVRTALGGFLSRNAY